MNIFGKKENAAKGDVPSKKIENMRKAGLSDKDIIKKLKGEGFSYSQIEKALLHSLKHNVSDDVTDAEDEIWKDEPRRDEAPTLEDIYGKPDEPSGPSLDEIMSPGIDEEDFAPELAIEELVEGVVNEKWEIFESELKKIRAEQETFTRKIKQIENLAASTMKETKANALEKKFGELDDKIGEIEARINGVEKAFKQFLPSLTDNIRSLSRMVREVRTGKDEAIAGSARGLDEDLI